MYKRKMNTISNLVVRATQFFQFFLFHTRDKCSTSFSNGHLHLTFQAKSEERSQALAMLMLQYCAGYQSCVEAEELDSYRL